MPKIRQATPDELDDLIKMERDSYAGHAYPHLVLRQFLDMAGPFALVAIEDDEVIGHTIALPAVSDGEPEAWLVALAVQEDLRGRGTGRLLSSVVLRRVVDRGYRIVRLTVEPDNDAAVSLYESLGFLVKDKVDDYFGEGEPRLVMRWEAKLSEHLLSPFG